MELRHGRPHVASAECRARARPAAASSVRCPPGATARGDEQVGIDGAMDPAEDRLFVTADDPGRLDKDGYTRGNDRGLRLPERPGARTRLSAASLPSMPRHQRAAGWSTRATTAASSGVASKVPNRTHAKPPEVPQRGSRNCRRQTTMPTPAPSRHGATSSCSRRCPQVARWTAPHGAGRLFHTGVHGRQAGRQHRTSTPAPAASRWARGDRRARSGVRR